MPKAKERYILPALGIKKVLKVLVKTWKKIPLINKSIFDFSITFSDIKYKCSNDVEIEN
jgi:hypothetical protein